MIGTAATRRGPRARPVGALAVLALLLGVPSVSGWAQPAPGPTASARLVVADWEVFAGKGCAQCHRVRGVGSGDVGPDLGRLESRTGFFEIAAAMWNHLPSMRAPLLERGVSWPGFIPHELSNLIAFLFTAQEGQVRGDPAAGARLFVSRACERCHGAESQGRRLGPSVDGLKRSLSPVVLVAAMWNHSARMDLAMLNSGGESFTLSGTDLSDIVAYIASAGDSPRAGSAPIAAGIADRGRALFADKGCARCHAVAGQGSGRGPRLDAGADRPSIVELAQRMSKHGAPIRAEVMTRGIRAPRLTAPEAADIVAYLHASYYFDTSAGDMHRGRRLLQDKGCLRCHAIYSRGAHLAPDLATSNVVRSQTGQLAAMWNHGRYMDNKARRHDIPLPTLTAQELSDITRYLAGLGGVGPRRP